MNKYFQFEIFWKASVNSEPVRLQIIGNIILESENTVDVEYTLPNGVTERRVFRKEQGFAFNYLFPNEISANKTDPQ